MPRTLTVVLQEDGSVNLITGGDIPPALAAQLCLQAFQAFQRRAVGEEMGREMEKDSDKEEPGGG